MKATSTRRRWLVVDDNPQVLDLAARMLRMETNAEVVPCSRPEEAIEACLADPDGFELLLTDFDMPCMDGIELASVLGAAAPHLRVILMTGSQLNEIQLLRAEVNLVLPKPFTREMLMDGVTALLGGRQDGSRIDGFVQPVVCSN